MSFGVYNIMYTEGLNYSLRCSVVVFLRKLCGFICCLVDTHGEYCYLRGSRGKGVSNVVISPSRAVDHMWGGAFWWSATGWEEETGDCEKTEYRGK